MRAADLLCEYGYEDVVIFDNPSFDEAFIGVTEDNRAVYDYDRMADSLAVSWGISREEAIEFIDYNTIRALAYCENAPVVMYRISQP